MAGEAELIGDLVAPQKSLRGTRGPRSGAVRRNHGLGQSREVRIVGGKRGSVLTDLLRAVIMRARINHIGLSVKNTHRLAKSTFLFGLLGLVVGCFVGPREGYYDSNQHRYYHENGWHDCTERDEHCH